MHFLHFQIFKNINPELFKSMLISFYFSSYVGCIAWCFISPISVNSLKPVRVCIMFPSCSHMWMLNNINKRGPYLKELAPKCCLQDTNHHRVVKTNSTCGFNFSLFWLWEPFKKKKSPQCSPFLDQKLTTTPSFCTRWFDALSQPSHSLLLQVAPRMRFVWG